MQDRAGSVTGCESTSIFYDLRLAQSSRSFVSIEKQWRATHGSDQLTAVSCSVAARSGHAAPLPLLPLFLLPVHSYAHHHFSFTCVYRAVVVVNARLSADETRFFYLRAHTVKVVVEMLLTTVYTAIFRSSCHTHTYKFFH